MDSWIETSFSIAFISVTDSLPCGKQDSVIIRQVDRGAFHFLVDFRDDPPGFTIVNDVTNVTHE